MINTGSVRVLRHKGSLANTTGRCELIKCSVSCASTRSTFVFNCHINCFDITVQRQIKNRPLCGGGHPHETNRGVKTVMIQLRDEKLQDICISGSNTATVSVIVVCHECLGRNCKRIKALWASLYRVLLKMEHFRWPAVCHVSISVSWFGPHLSSVWCALGMNRPSTQSESATVLAFC